jgi:SAM-dependent methyltransferase
MSHYDKKYFEWQKRMGEFGGKENLFKFERFVKPDDKVIEFGCGGGYLLKNLKCKEKIGIEINPYAREAAEKNGINVVEKTEDINDDWADIIISDNALEHALSPYDELKRLYAKLKPGGTIVFIVPHETAGKFIENDINQHLYTWSPICAGNLFKTVRFKVDKVEAIRHLWPPLAFQIRKFSGKHLFNLLCRINCLLFKNWYQVRVIAHK